MARLRYSTTSTTVDDHLASARARATPTSIVTPQSNPIPDRGICRRARRLEKARELHYKVNRTCANVRIAARGTPAAPAPPRGALLALARPNHGHASDRHPGSRVRPPSPSNPATRSGNLPPRALAMGAAGRNSSPAIQAFRIPTCSRWVQGLSSRLLSLRRANRRNTPFATAIPSG